MFAALRRRRSSARWLAVLAAQVGASVGAAFLLTCPVAFAAPPSPGVEVSERKPMASTRVKLSFEGGEAVVELKDGPTSRDLVSMLPLTLKFSDYNSVEKIAYPPRKLTTQGAAMGMKPEAGDFAVYAPWGNLVVYYRGFERSNDLIHLGRFVSGVDKLAAMRRDFDVRLELEKP